MEDIDYQVGIQKKIIADIQSSYVTIFKNYPVKNITTIGQSPRYAQINQLLVPLHNIMAIYHGHINKLYEGFITSFDAEMGDVEPVNIKLDQFSSIYYVDMVTTSQQIYLLNEEKRELEVKLNYKFPV
ncbi:hypothetical protein [Dyadobacter psychrotolerans]|uniref:Uncharacterized protein n=1 Tax=Dyadobacter psychrotolerans TaxID=2541721 RepID=A0A4R5E1M5_9BACT|nr:hypothetical protein [Dyadobacter psychrotolerans]TDE17733.1 hypothetical protein E0F88_07530 [Dyadobacter psychrotolerans]